MGRATITAYAAKNFCVPLTMATADSATGQIPVTSDPAFAGKVVTSSRVTALKVQRGLEGGNSCLPVVYAT